MADVEELVVRASPENIDQTTDQLEGMEEQFEETADGMEEQSTLFQEMANSISGLMGAVVAGLALGVGGILTQVPVLGEVLSGVISVVQALAFQLDKRLRPVLTPITEGLFELSSAIFEGDFDRAATIFQNLVSQIAEIDFGPVISSFSDMVDAILSEVDASALFGNITSAIVTFFSETLPNLIQSTLVGIDWIGIWETVTKLFQNAHAALTDGLLRLMRAVDWSRVATTAIALLVSFIIETLKARAAIFVAAGMAFVDAIIDGIKARAAMVLGVGAWILQKVEDGIDTVIEDGVEWGEDLINNFVQGIQNRIEWAQGKVKSAFEKITPDIQFDIRENDQMAQMWGADMIEHFVRGAENQSQTQNVPLPVDDGPVTVPQPTNGDVYLDGQLINENQSRYGQSKITRNGGR